MDAIERVGPADLGSCLSLSGEARWNQCGADWMHILTFGECYGVRRSGRLVATCAILPYGDLFGWICMMLVAEEHRRHGLAKRLIQYAIVRLRSLDLIPGLDATPEGRSVYLELGFRDVFPLGRYWAARPEPAPAPTSVTARIERLSAVTSNLAHFDAGCFGTSRAPLLESLVSRNPELAKVARNGDRIIGFGLGRAGRSATQIGPLVATSEDAAISVAAAVLRAASAGPMLIDVPDRQGQLLAWLAASGFERQRGYTRMLHGRNEPIGNPAQTMAIAGPELA